MVKQQKWVGKGSFHVPSNQDLGEIHRPAMTFRYIEDNRRVFKCSWLDCDVTKTYPNYYRV